ncbi:fucolectin-like [Misgurnus anguillicaudatus]|uniref:fucolectin-like n=1 Tax=Misgurnus anguillicaudatus TaxID=75329 RepID=UPI003CCFD944
MWMLSCLYVLFGAVLTTTLATTAQEEGNLSLKGRAAQSSTAHNWVAANALDTSNFTCTHTNVSDNPWWRLDLLDSYPISTIVIINRADCCADRLDGAEIRIGNSLVNDGNNNPRCAVLYGVGLGQSVSVSCNNMEGRYVNVIVPGRAKIVTLCDVKVYTHVYKAVMRMKFTSIFNLSDPAESNKVLNQMKTALTSRGFSDFSMTWTKLPVRQKTKLVTDGPCFKGPFRQF